MKNFVESYLAGENPNIDDFVDQWHQTDHEDGLLSEFLGLTIEEYAAWVQDSSKLPEILEDKKFSIPTLVGPDSPPPLPFYAHSCERSLDPFHISAFEGIKLGNVTSIGGAELKFGSRKSGWDILDWCGNQVGFVADGETIQLRKYKEGWA